MKINKLLLIFGLLSILITTSCFNRSKANEEIYGNYYLFIATSKSFIPPKEWKTYYSKDSSYSIKIPPYMRNAMPLEDEVNGGKIYQFKYDTQNVKKEYHYALINMIDFILPGSFNYADEWINVYDENVQKILNKMVENNTAEDSVGLIKAPKVEVLNGPFFSCYSIYPSESFKPFHVIDTYYRRTSSIGDGPVSVHILIMQNKDEMVRMTMAFKDKDSLMFKNMFNAVKTFQWRAIKRKPVI